MAIPLEKLTEEALALPADARAILADRLAESLDPMSEEDFRVLWATEGLRRRDEIRSGKLKAIASELVFSRIQKGLSE